MKNFRKFSIFILFFSLTSAPLAVAEETGTSTEAGAAAVATANTGIGSDIVIVEGIEIPRATSTPATSDATSTPAISDTVASSTPLVSEPAPLPPEETLLLPQSPEPPAPPTAQPVAPFISANGSGFDQAVAPSIVKLKVIDTKGNIPTSSVFVSFIGVGGRSYGGPLDNEGAIKVIMPSGRYYSDFLVVDTHYGPPTNPPAFFLEANDERDLGVVSLSDASAFTDTALEAEVGQTLKQESGMAKIFSLIVKLLLAILKEIRGLRTDMLVE